jgi:hypothetical protein
MTVTEALTTTTSSTDESSQLPETRDDKGRFVAGVSGNPKGRPKGKKNVITELKQDMEIALRENLSVEDIKGVIQSMLAEALNGNVGAGKLILDKVLSSAKESEDAKESGGGLKIVIEHANIDAFQKEGNNIIEAIAEEVKNEQGTESES